MSLDQDFWNQHYIDQQTGWDIGKASPPLVEIFNTIENKNATILIPGCGNAYEAQYLLDDGFTNITLIDIAPLLVKQLQAQYCGNSSIQIICQDFFEHKGQYGYIIEQTFFCALDPKLRQAYAQKMHSLLNPKGILRGVLFNRMFEKEGPPFGGTEREYRLIFESLFDVQIEECTTSYPARLGNEVVLYCLKTS